MPVNHVTGNGASAGTEAANAPTDQWQPQLLSQSPAVTSSSWSSFPDLSSNGVRPPDMKRGPSPGTPDTRKRVRKSEVDQRQVKFDAGQDFYCWSCHKEKATHSCSTCCRSFHGKCLTSAGVQKVAGDQKLLCSDCQLIRDTSKKPARALRSLNKQELNHLILDVVLAVKETADPSFHQPVVLSNYPDYKEKIIHPVSFQDMEKKCSDSGYSCTYEMLSDLMWIQHNSVIYNSASHALTSNAKQFVKLARGKIADLETCPDCFKNLNSKPSTWFTETCRKPHVLVLARVTGQSLPPHTHIL